jgi:riboflavin synthase
MVFTGLVQAVGFASFNSKTNIVSVRVPGSSYWSKALKGDSIAVNGVCLTLLEASETDTGTFFVMEESRSKTNLADIGDQEYEVNLEHALRHGDSVGGHTVTGHVDGVARIARVEPRPDGSRDVWIDLSGFSPNDVYVVFKGSIALDGMQT